MENSFPVYDANIASDVKKFLYYLLTRHPLSVVAAATENNLASSTLADMLFYVVKEADAAIEI